MNRNLVFALMLCLSTGATAQNNNPLRDSLKVASERLSFHPDSIDLRLKKAGWNIQLEEWQNAKIEYDIVLRHEPTNIAALYYRAFCNERLGRYNFARLDYQNVLTLVPGNFEARLGLALLNEKDKHYTEALDGINQLVTAYPDSAVAWAARAGIESERGMNELAEYDYGKALQLDPDNKDYLLARADLRIKLLNYTDAKQDLDRLVQLGTPRAALKEWYDKILKDRH
jgi:Tfp pilus assembly protein PilF